MSGKQRIILAPSKDAAVAYAREVGIPPYAMLTHIATGLRYSYLFQGIRLAGTEIHVMRGFEDNPYAGKILATLERSEVKTGRAKWVRQT